MNFRFALAVTLVLFAQATLTASTTYGFGTIGGNNPGEGISLASESTPYQTAPTADPPFWTEAYFGTLADTTQQITCVVAVTNTTFICGDTGPGTANTIDIPAAPNSSSLPAGTSDYLMVDGDPDYGAPVWTEMTSLVVNESYTVSFYQASSEESGNDKAYTDNWEAYVIPGTGPGPYICPQSYCAGISEQTTTDSGDLAYNSPGMVNSGAVSTAWELESFTFVATTTNEVLEFVTNAVGTSGFEPPFLGLADVTLTASTPEPGTWVMTILGVGLVFGAGRLRRRFSARG
jgi:hypothetical protein